MTVAIAGDFSLGVEVVNERPVESASIRVRAEAKAELG
jgi:hypothetical protein